MSGPLIDWDSPQWGVAGINTHEAAWCPDRHDNERDGDDQ